MHHYRLSVPKQSQGKQCDHRDSQIAILGINNGENLTDAYIMHINGPKGLDEAEYL